jgi:tRNA (guanine26-N2/guanine27-N2)-dimethyltransferase
MNLLSEGLAKINLKKGVFFNPEMKVCRDFTSLWISVLPKLNILVDGFCASGIRGIRYKLENKNVSDLIFFDRSQTAILNTKQNLKLNKLKGEVFKGNSNEFFVNYQNFDFCEIDPFGSPAQYLDLLFWADWKQKTRYVSITATDTAVLCGAHKNACIKLYSSFPAHNFACHEIGIRILLGHIAKVASKYDWKVSPHLSFSLKHFFKLFLEINKSASGAKSSSENSHYYYLFCEKCLNQKFIKLKDFDLHCDLCNNTFSFAGPLWGEQLALEQIVNKIYSNYNSDSKEFLKDQYNQKVLKVLLEEFSKKLDFPYFDIHKVCSVYKLKPPKLLNLVNSLKETGFFCSRTTFNENAIRTNASITELVKIIKNLN